MSVVSKVIFEESDSKQHQEDDVIYFYCLVIGLLILPKS